MDHRIAAALCLFDAPRAAPPSVTQLAAAACLSKYHFHRLFKQHTGLSPHQYGVRQRLHRACQALLTTDSAVLDLALAAGYADYETFSRAFKHVYKVASHDLRGLVRRATELALESSPTFLVQLHVHSIAPGVPLTNELTRHLAGLAPPDFVVVAMPQAPNVPLPPGAVRVRNKFHLQSAPGLCHRVAQRLRRLCLLLLLTLVSPMAATVYAQAPTSLEQHLLSQGYRKVPLTKYVTGHFTMELLVNQVPGHFLLDPGSSVTLIDQRLVHKFRGRLESSSRTGTGVGGQGVALERSPGNLLQLANQLSFSNYTTYSMALEHVNAAFRQHQLAEIEGVVGADLLTQGAAVLDYTTNTLYLKAN